MMGNFGEVLNFNRLFLKLNQFNVTSSQFSSIDKINMLVKLKESWLEVV